MSVLLVSPSGKRDPEVGLIYLMGRFLIGQGHHVSQLICNGVSVTCDRDADSHWRRGVHSCLTCMQEQKDLAQWGGIGAQRLSEGVDPTTVQESIRWIDGLPYEALWGASFKGVQLAELIRDTFELRFGVRAPDLNNKQHERFLRTLLAVAARLHGGVVRSLQHKTPDMILLPANAGLIASIVAKAAHAQKVPVFAWQSNLAKRCTTVHAEHSGQLHECPLVIEDVLALRSDIKTWSPDLLSILKVTEEFLGLACQRGAVPVNG